MLLQPEILKVIGLRLAGIGASPGGPWQVTLGMMHQFVHQKA